MCGIAGFWARERTLDALAGVVDSMTDALARRGPDDAGRWLDETAGFALGHRRLSVLDTTSAGRQPMASANGRYVISFNGEVFNFASIKEELRRDQALPRVLRSTSDTEILLAAIEAWGLRSAVE